MENKAIAPVIPIIISLFVISGIGIGLYYFNDFTKTQETFRQFSKPECTFIKNPNDPNLTWTERTSASSYVCNNSGDGTEECIVWGSMNINKSTNVPTVLARVSDIDYGLLYNWIAVDCIPEGTKCTKTPGTLHGYKASGGFGSTTATKYPLPGGHIFSVYNSKIRVTNRGFIYEPTALTSEQLSTTPQTDCSGFELCDSNYKYSAFWNFCPPASSNNNFPYCSPQSNNFILRNNASWVTTALSESGEAILNTNAGTNTVTFIPVYNNSNRDSVEEKFIYSRKADCSCGNPTKGCKAEQYRCLRCPVGYTYSNYQYCYSYEGSVVYTYRNNVCYNSASTCIDPFKQKQACDGSHVVNSLTGKTCKWWNTQIACSTNQKCYEAGTNNLVDGAIGDCKCINDACINGSIEVNPSNSQQFRFCTQGANGCWGYTELWRTCADGLKYDNTVKRCVQGDSYNNEDKCDPNVDTFKCSIEGGTKYKTCKKYVINDIHFKRDVETYFFYEDNCAGVQVCRNNLCVCDTSCVVGSSCRPDNSNTNNYFACYKNVNCPEYNSVSSPLPNCKICSNGVLTTNINKCSCVPCEADYDCVNDVCVAKSTGEYCQASQVGTSTCVDQNTKKTCTLISGSGSSAVYKWVTVTNTDTTNLICTNGKFVCKTADPFCDISTFTKSCNGLTKETACEPINGVADQDGKQCYKINKDIACAFDKECKSPNTQCSCKVDGDYCPSNKVNTKICVGDIDGKLRKECRASGNCYKWESMTSCDTNIERCNNGTCSKFGCWTNSTGEACSERVDANKIKIETCVANTCVNPAINDEYSATKDDYINLNTKCLDNKIMKTVKYSSGTDVDSAHKLNKIDSIYRWELETTCSGDTAICIEI